MGVPPVSVAVVQNGAMLAVTVMEPGVVTAAVLESVIAAISTSICDRVSDPLVISIVAVFVDEVIVAVPLVPVPETNEAAGLPLTVDTVGFADKVSVTPVGTLLNVS
jgi:hypothetical protein